MRVDLELYREELITEADENGAVQRISFIDVAPERPEHVMLLVHGFGGQAKQWRYQISEFADRNRVIAVDLRGHGDSSRPRRGSYEMHQLLADLVAVLDYLSINQPVVLMGHSFGVAIATEFSLQYPERVGRLILIAGAGEYEIAPLFRLAFSLPESVLGLLQPLANRFIVASVRSLRQLYLQNMRDWQGWDKFPLLKPVTMVILGNRDVVLPQEAFERVTELVPAGSEIVNVGVSAHMVMLERRDAVNRAIARFISSDDGERRQARWRDAGNRGGFGSLLRERPWLAQYESGVPPTIHVPQVPLTRILDRAWRRFPRRPATVFAGHRLTYRNLSAQAGRFANGLAAVGIGKGSRVMLVLPNVPHLVIAYFGVLRLGAVVVMSNPLESADELARQASQSGAEVLVTLTKFEALATAIKAQSGVRHVIFCNVKDYFPPWSKALFSLRRERKEGHRLRRPLDASDRLWHKMLRSQVPQPPKNAVSSTDTAVIQFTTGTTGEPKGIMLSHSNLVANMLQTRLWLTDSRDGHEVILCVVPFSHAYGMTAAMLVSISLGASMILLPTFQVEEVLRSIKKYQPSLFPGVPSMYVSINNFPGVRRFNVRSIRACISGAAPLPLEVKESFEKLTKGKLVEGYGLTEASPVTHANPIYGRNKVGSIGIPLPGTEARIVDLQTAKPLPPGQIGELQIRGPQVMQGYWQDTASTSEALTLDGWLRTNDVARMDEDGFCQIISRKQDMWQAGDGQPAFPRDVEEVIYELPEVDEAVVVAVADRPVAFVSLKPRNKIPRRTIIAYCARRLPPEQVPRLVFIVGDFPRSFIGKILRRELVEQYEQKIRAEAGSVGQYLAGLDDEVDPATGPASS